MQWDIEKGFPPNDFFRMVHPGLDGLVENKLGTNVHSAYSRAGGISQEIATRTGLLPGTSVCCANGDGNIPLSCLNIDREGIGALILGTSSVLMFLTKKPVFVGGSMGVVNSVLLPGYYGHVFGQSAAGDALAWYMENLLPHRYYLEAAANGISIYTLMDNKISQIAPGQNGLVGLDWYNGCRSLLMDSRLSAALIGINMHTRPEDIYRSIIESMAFGFRKILNTCKENGIVLNCIRACGGLARRKSCFDANLCRRSRHPH